MRLLTSYWLRMISCWIWLLLATLVLTSACAHPDLRPTASSKPIAGVCKRDPMDLAMAVREQSQKFEICARLTDRNEAGEYVLGFVATPSGEPLSVMLLGADLEPIGGQAPACFATVVEDVGLARSGGGECPVTVPLLVPTPPIKVTTREMPSERHRDADGWLVSALESAPPWPNY